MISNTFNFLLTLKNRLIHWQTLYVLSVEVTCIIIFWVLAFCSLVGEY